MKKDFKRAGYLLAIIVFFLGISALIISSVVNFFSYSDAVVIIGEFVSFVAFILLMIICIFAKSDYNYISAQFADYILDKRKKDAEYQMSEAEHLKQIQNMKSAAEHERDNAVAAALEQGRSEGAHAALQSVGGRPSGAPGDNPSPSPAPQPQSQPRQTPGYMQPLMPNDEILYNEYGEPVMIRRRVRKNREHYNGDVLYDRFGNPVARRAQNIWEIGGQKIQVANSPEPSAEPAAQQPQQVPQQTAAPAPQQAVSQQPQQVQPQTVPQQPPHVQQQVVSQQPQQVQQPQAAPTPQTIISQTSPTTDQSSGQQPVQFFRKTTPSEPNRYF